MNQVYLGERVSIEVEYTLGRYSQRSFNVNITYRA